jgi:malate/lactate dehydrogenase
MLSILIHDPTKGCVSTVQSRKDSNQKQPRPGHEQKSGAGWVSSAIISISVPTIVGHAGVIDHVELDLWPKKVQGLQASGRALRETLNKVI